MDTIVAYVSPARVVVVYNRIEDVQGRELWVAACSLTDPHRGRGSGLVVVAVAAAVVVV